MTGHPDPLDRGRLRAVGATILINVAAVSLLAFAPWSDWRTGLALNLIDNALLLAGLTGGATIFVCYALAHALTDGLVRAK